VFSTTHTFPIALRKYLESSFSPYLCHHFHSSNILYLLPGQRLASWLASCLLSHCSKSITILLTQLSFGKCKLDHFT
jgi:hypothetical protein